MYTNVNVYFFYFEYVFKFKILIRYILIRNIKMIKYILFRIQSLKGPLN